MKFLIIGSGYLGKVLEEELIKRKHSFTVFDSNLLGLTKEGIDKYGNKTIIDSSLNKKGALNSFKNYDVMINTAAVVGDPACLVDTKFALMNNCVATRNMVEKANRDKKPIIHFSTCSTYGSENCSLDNPLTEMNKVFPIDFYGQTKYQQERFIELAENSVMFRLATAQGQSPRMRYDLVIPTFTAKAINDKKIVVYGGEQWRPFVHVRDVARAVIFASENFEKFIGRVFNLTSENLTIKQVAETIKKIYPETKIEINKMITDPRNYIVSNKKLLDTGFKFKWNVEKGIKEMGEAKTIKEYDRVIYSNEKLALLKKMGIKL